ncbi:MAG: type II toxin-antitoxin system RelE family toxin [Thauera sp.]
MLPWYLLQDPRSIGEALKGSRLGAFWKYRVGDWRIIANIEDGALRILVVRIGDAQRGLPPLMQRRCWRLAGALTHLPAYAAQQPASQGGGPPL